MSYKYWSFTKVEDIPQMFSYHSQLMGVIVNVDIWITFGRGRITQKELQSILLIMT